MESATITFKVQVTAAPSKESLTALIQTYHPNRITYKHNWAYFDFAHQKEASRFDEAVHKGQLAGLGEESFQLAGDLEDRKKELDSPEIQITSLEELRGLVMPADVGFSASELNECQPSEEMLPLESTSKAGEFMCISDEKSNPASPKKQSPAIQFSYLGTQEDKTIAIELDFEAQEKGESDNSKQA